jgi:hypothetical protein
LPSYSCPKPADTNGDGKVDDCGPGGDSAQTVHEVQVTRAQVAAILKHCATAHRPISSQAVLPKSAHTAAPKPFVDPNAYLRR